MVSTKTSHPVNPVSANGKVKFHSLSTNVNVNNKGEVIIDIDDVKVVKYAGNRYGLTATAPPNGVKVSTFIAASVAEEIKKKYGKKEVLHHKSK